MLQAIAVKDSEDILHISRGIDIGKSSLYDKFFYVLCDICNIPRWVKRSDYCKGVPCRRCSMRKVSRVLVGKPSWNKNKVLSKQHRENISKAHKGNKRPDLSGFNHWTFKGTKEKTREQIISSIRSKLKGKARLYHHIRRGPDSHSWKGGVSKINENARKSDEFIKWRKDVYARDNYTCQKCGKHGGRINAHHIIPFSIDIDKRFDLDNGVTLCIPCHSRIHMNERWKNVRNNNTVSIGH